MRAEHPRRFRRPPCLLCCPSWACARRVWCFVRPSSCVFVFFAATISVTCHRLVCARAPRPLLFLPWHRLLSLPSTQLPLVLAASRPRPPRSAQPRQPFHRCWRRAAGAASLRTAPDARCTPPNTPHDASRIQNIIHKTPTQLPTHNNASRTRRTPPTPDDASRMQYRHKTCATSPGPGPIVYYIFINTSTLHLHF